MEAKVFAWIAAVTGKKVSDMSELKDGVILCELANKISVGSIKRINNSTMPFKQMENITAFLVACRGAGVKSHDLFETVDLFDGKDYGLVVQSIFAYGSVVTNAPGYSGPTLGVKVADKNEREFSAEVLAKGKNSVPQTSHGKIMDHGTKEHRDIGFGAKASGASVSSEVPKTSHGKIMDHGTVEHREISFGAKKAGTGASGAVPKTSSGPAIDFGEGTTHRDIGFGAKHAGVSKTADVPKTNVGKAIEAPASSHRDIKRYA
jgi:hypothetical protein